MKIALTDAAFPDVEQERAVALRHGADFVAAKSTGKADLLAAADGANVLVVQFAAADADVLGALAPGARVVRYGIGLDNIDLSFAKDRGIPVAYVPDYATGEVADHTATLALTLARRVAALDASVRAGEWDAVGAAGAVRAFDMTTVGFLGFGRIGMGVWQRLKAFGVSGIVHDPYADPQAMAEAGVRQVSLDELFAQADILTLHAPLTAANRHVVNAASLAAMKPSAYLVNTARGGLVDPAALADALAGGTIAGAALDVFEEEPLPASSVLRGAPNLLLTPHAAWYSTSAIRRLQAMAADEIDRHFTGQAPRCPAPLPN